VSALRAGKHARKRCGGGTDVAAVGAVGADDSVEHGPIVSVAAGATASQCGMSGVLLDFLEQKENNAIESNG
jgi:hypothetical protein